MNPNKWGSVHIPGKGTKIVYNVTKTTAEAALSPLKTGRNLLTAGKQLPGQMKNSIATKWKTSTLNKTLKAGKGKLFDKGGKASSKLPAGAGWASETGDIGAAARYAEIAKTDDIAVLAKNANVPENVIASVKKHLFVTEHRVPIGPNQLRTGKFYAMDEIADLWEAARKGNRLDEFRNFLGHEYLESTLMKHLDVPYVSSHPDAWIDPSDWTSMSTERHFGAHDLSPNPWSGNLSEFQMRQWELFLSRGN